MLDIRLYEDFDLCLEGYLAGCGEVVGDIFIICPAKQSMYGDPIIFSVPHAPLIIRFECVGGKTDVDTCEIICVCSGEKECRKRLGQLRRADKTGNYAIPFQWYSK